MEELVAELPCEAGDGNCGEVFPVLTCPLVQIVSDSGPPSSRALVLDVELEGGAGGRLTAGSSAADAKDCIERRIPDR